MKSDYKIGEVAESLETTVRTIRFYEEEGLLQPFRTGGGTRLYSQRHISRLKAILHLAENGFSIDSIRVIASIREACKTGDESSGKVIEQLDDELKSLSSRIGELQKLENEIAQAQTAVRMCKGCKNEPTSGGCPNCPVISRATSVELLNLIWDQGV